MALYRKYTECVQSSIFLFDILYRVTKSTFQKVTHLPYHEKARSQVFKIIEKTLRNNENIQYARVIYIANQNYNRYLFEQFTQAASLELIQHMVYCKKEFGNRAQFYLN